MLKKETSYETINALDSACRRILYYPKPSRGTPVGHREPFGSLDSVVYALCGSQSFAVLFHRLLSPTNLFEAFGC